MRKKPNGGVRLEKMLREGQITGPFLYIDTYNLTVNDKIVGAVTTRIDARSQNYVSVPADET